jgi:hypothetical protein
MVEGREFVPFDPTKASSALPPVLAYFNRRKIQEEWARRSSHWYR